jgi:hypothetical protein
MEVDEEAAAPAVVPEEDVDDLSDEELEDEPLPSEGDAVRVDCLSCVCDVLCTHHHCALVTGLHARRRVVIPGGGC